MRIVRRGARSARHGQADGRRASRKAENKNAAPWGAAASPAQVERSARSSPEEGVTRQDEQSWQPCLHPPTFRGAPHARRDPNKVSEACGPGTVISPCPMSPHGITITLRTSRCPAERRCAKYRPAATVTPRSSRRSQLAVLVPATASPSNNSRTARPCASNNSSRADAARGSVNAKRVAVWAGLGAGGASARRTGRAISSTASGRMSARSMLSRGPMALSYVRASPFTTNCCMTCVGVRAG